MVEIPTIEPFHFIRSTAFSERVQLANKLNEVIDALNSIGDLPDLESQITELNSKVSQLEESIGSTDTSLAELENQVNALISEVNTTIKQSISALESEVDGIDTRLTAAESTISEHESEINGLLSDVNGIDTRLTTAEGTISEHESEINGLLKEVIDTVVMTSSPHGTVQVQINHEDGSNDISAPIDLGLVEQGGIVLQSGTTDRSFKLIVKLTDGTSWQTNDFVIPEGGGTEVSVTNISITQGTGADKIQVKIGLSDGSTISSNDWTVVTPSEFSALGTRVTTAEGNISRNTGDITQNTEDISTLGTRVTTAEGNITKNTGDISDLDTRLQAIEDSPGFTLQPATAVTLGGVKIGTNITVTSDGTISVPIAGTALGLVKNGGNVVIAADGSMNVTLPSVPTQYLKTADVAIEGTSKMATFTVTDQANATKGIIIQKGSDENTIELMEQNGTNVADLPLVEKVTAQIIDESTLQIAVNGILGTVALPSSTNIEYFTDQSLFVTANKKVGDFVTFFLKANSVKIGNLTKQGTISGFGYIENVENLSIQGITTLFFSDATMMSTGLQLTDSGVSGGWVFYPTYQENPVPKSFLNSDITASNILHNSNVRIMLIHL